MITAYDLDGVLAEGPEPSNKPWGKMSGIERAERKTQLLYHYSRAKKLFTPPENTFSVITARKGNDPDVVAVTSLWLNRHFPNRVSGLYMLTAPRSLKNVIQFKGAVLREIQAEEFTEDNPNVLKGLKFLHINLYYFDGLVRAPV